MRTVAAFCVLSLFTCLSTATRAADLKVGDAAPGFDVGNWVQGEPIKSMEKGKVYVVEFWATWCGPCRATIPHLNELSKTHKDVTFIGVDIWEQDESKVAPFVKEMGDKMTYRVALDNKSKETEGAMSKTWMRAAGRNGIPSAFIVDKESKIAWMGHPASMDKSLAAIVDGTFDPKAEAAKAAAEEALQNDVREKVITPMRSGKTDEALAALEALMKANPEQRSNLLGMKAGILMQKKDLPAVYEIMDELAAAKEANPMMLNGMAWAILVEEPFAAKRDVDRAIKYAQTAVDATKGKDAQVLDTLARGHAMKGDFDKAVEVQQKAVDAASADLATKLSKTLESYKQKKVPGARE
jgi:thiol-disulfide isomerase/thioredoxin